MIVAPCAGAWIEIYIFKGMIHGGDTNGNGNLRNENNHDNNNRRQ